MISLNQSPELKQNIGEPVRPLAGKRAAMVLFSYYPGDPRPRRAAEALAAQGLSVDLICLRENPSDAKREQLNGVDIRRVPISRRRGGIWGYFYQYLAFLVVSSTIILGRSVSRRYHLVYVNNMPDFLVLSGFIPKLFGAKVILDLHDPMPELMQTIFSLPPTASSVRLLRRIEKWSIRLADSVITVNQACAKIFATRSCSREKITVVMNTPDEEIFRSNYAKHEPSLSKEGEGTFRSRNGAKPFVVMYHGSLVERNGLALAVDAFARVHQSIPSAELRIYGSRNSFLDGVMESVRARQLDDAVHYMGPRPLEQIVEAIDSCDVGIIPNLRNIFTELNTPTRIFEYLALGKPVIAPRAPGITDYFEEDSLVFFELGDAADLARKIEYVFHNAGEVKEVVQRAGQIHSAHTWREEKSRLITLVSQLLADQRDQIPSAVGAPQGNQQGR
jgi:glycosyltransferase involved in cell wall biosynthesis